jgi:demethylmenaquinone methyltransferase/2-methoxy-6-polyprenyl-1,4-benzoquinol methylase
VVCGADFSKGMLQQAKRKNTAESNIHLIQANVANLPFRRNVFDAVTCSHAFYELKVDTSHRCLREVVRVLRHEGRFVMMEHDIPNNLFVRFLFYVRVFSMGRNQALQILNTEEPLFREYFGSVHRIKTETRRSKILIGLTNCHEDIKDVV